MFGARRGNIGAILDNKHTLDKEDTKKNNATTRSKKAYHKQALHWHVITQKVYFCKFSFCRSNIHFFTAANDIYP